jgi:hypothetical protein
MTRLRVCLVVLTFTLLFIARIVLKEGSITSDMLSVPLAPHQQLLDKRQTLWETVIEEEKLNSTVLHTKHNIREAHLEMERQTEIKQELLQATNNLKITDSPTTFPTGAYQLINVDTKFPLVNKTIDRGEVHWPLGNVLIILLCPDGDYSRAEQWVELYRRHFPLIVVYGTLPKSKKDDDATQRVNARVRNVSSLIDSSSSSSPNAISHMLTVAAIADFPNFQGYMFAHDDVFIAPFHFGFQFMHFESSYTDLLPTLQQHEEQDFHMQNKQVTGLKKNTTITITSTFGNVSYWQSSPFAVNAITQVLGNPNFKPFVKTMRRQCTSEFHWYATSPFCCSRWAYIASTDMLQFVEFQRLMAKYSVMTQIAIPTFMKCVARERHKFIEVPSLSRWTPSIPIVFPVSLDVQKNILWMRNMLHEFDLARHLTLSPTTSSPSSHPSTSTPSRHPYTSTPLLQHPSTPRPSQRNTSAHNHN